MTGAALGIGVDHVDQLTHGVHAVAQHLRRIAPGSGHHAVAHHQQPVIAARQEALDHHLADLGCHAVGHVELFARGDVDGDALALVAVLRLDHDGQADLQRHGPGFVDAGHRPAIRHRHTGGEQQLLGEVLVLRDRLGHRAGDINLGSLDATLSRTPAELHQAALGEAAVRNAARGRGIHDGTGARAEAHVFVGVAQTTDGGIHIKRMVAHGGLEQRLRQRKRLTPDLFFAVFDDHLVHARLDRGRGAAVGHRAAGLRLQRQRQRLEQVRDRLRLLLARHQQRADGRKQTAHPGFDAGDERQGALGRRTLHHRLDGGVAAPEVGATQGPDAGHVHGLRFLPAGPVKRSKDQEGSSADSERRHRGGHCHSHRLAGGGVNRGGC